MIENNFDITLDVALLPYKILKAGHLNCMYEAGNLRYIKCGDTEIVRMVYGAVRNENWETISPEITEEIIEAEEDSFRISYTALYTKTEIKYTAKFIIEGKADSSLIIIMKGLALSDFKKNRIGLCVLHPLKENKGKELQIVKPGGDKYTAIFPELIAPHQPFKEIQQMQWQPATTLYAQIRFSGDTFETEDQRNWSDSSFKTYSTPLHLPFPALVKTGETMEQKIVLTVTGNISQPAEKIMQKKIPTNKIASSKMGYCMPSGQTVLTDEQVKFFKENSFDHYRVDIHLYKNYWQQQLLNAVTDAIKLNAKLELILFFENKYDEKLQLFLQQIKSIAQHIYALLLLDRKQAVTPPVLMQKGYTLIKADWPFIKVGYGTDAYFAALNRNPPGSLPHDFVSFSLMPQAHASDTRTILENLESLPDIIQTIQLFTDKDIHISPISIGRRINPDAVADEDYLVADTDPRTGTAFAAAWKLFCMQGLDKAASITFV
jgi:hypothetical protein